MNSEQPDTLVRLRRIEGQIRGLQRWIEAGKECEDVMTQLSAVRNGLEQVSLLLLDRHIRHCLLGDVEMSEDRIQGLQQTLRTWLRFGAPAAQLPD